MASGIAPPREPAGVPPEQRAAQYDDFIEDRLEKTQRQVKTVDVFTRLFALAVAVLAYLLVAALVDQWLVKEGLGFWGRFVLWLGLFGGSMFFLARAVLPLLIHRINPIYAAYTIEQSRPSFKNSLINLILLRRHREEFEENELAKHVFRGLQYRTAAELSQVPVEGTVDRTPLLRLTCALAVLVMICCGYLLFSPKDPITSFRRVMWPWAKVDAPTRVTIDAIDPGDTVAYQGESVAITAEAHGLREGETVHLVYSTVDGQTVDQVIPMTVPEGQYRYRCEVPGGNLGLQQDIEYYLTAGDFRTKPFKIEMQIPLSIVVDRVEYKYPDYTGLPARTVERQGDIQALEGTEVTIRATANQPIAQAMIEFDGDARDMTYMETSGNKAHALLTLQMNRDDPTQPWHSAYQVRFTDPQRRENRRPIRHRIEVTRDQRPDVQFVDRPTDKVQVPEAGSLPLKVRAEDPDFGLRRVVLRAEKDGKGLAIAPLLNKVKPEAAHKGHFETVYKFEPERLGLKAGDTVTYWAEAFDTKENANGPAPNHKETDKLEIVIVSNDRQPQQQPRQNSDGQPQRQRADQNPQKQDDPQLEQQTQPGDGQPDPSKPQDKDQQKTKSPKNEKKPGDNNTAKGHAENDSPAKPDRPQQNPEQKPDGSPQNGGQPGEGKNKPDKSKGQDPKNSGEKQDERSGGSSEQEPGNHDSRQDGASGEDASAKNGAKSGSKNEGTQNPDEPLRPETDPGRAINELLKHHEEQEKRNSSQKQSEGAKEPGAEEPGGDPNHEDNSKPASKPEGSGANEKPMTKGEAPNKDTQPNGANAADHNEREKPGEQPAGQAGSDEPKSNGDDPQKKQPGAKQRGSKAEGEGSKETGEKDAGTGTKQERAPNQNDSDPGAKKMSGEKQDGGKEKPPSGSRQESGAKGQESEKANSPNAKRQQDGAEGEGEKKPAGEPEPGKKSRAGKENDASKKGSQPEKEGANQPNSSASKQENGAKGANQQGAPKQEPSKQMEKSGPSGASSGSKPNKSEKTPDKNASGSTDQGAKEEPSEGQGESGKGGADEKPTTEKPANGTGEKPEVKGGNPKASQEKPGSGAGTEKQQPAPSPNQPQKSSQGQDDAPSAKTKEKPQEPPSASQSTRTSPSQRENEQGELSGAGGEGGGQQGKKPGAGDPGSKTASAQGKAGSKESGEGETASKPGERQKADGSTGKSADEGEGKGSQSRPGQEGGKPSAAKNDNMASKKGANPDNGKPQDGSPKSDAGKPDQPGKPAGSEQASKSDPSKGSGEPGKGQANQSGGQPGDKPAGGGTQGGGAPGKDVPPPPDAQTNPDPANLDYARKQTSLALRTLEEELAKPKSELLDRLGWKPQDANKFLREWQEMFKTAQEASPRGDRAKKDLQKALRGLGLQPRSSGPRDKTMSTDTLQQEDAGRFAPPPEWAEQYRDYMKASGSEK